MEPPAKAKEGSMSWVASALCLMMINCGLILTAITISKKSGFTVRLPRFRGQRVELFIKLPEAHGLPLPVRVAVGGRELCEQLDWDEGCATKS
jgi:hypothetical protein